ncbi:hypothetical protein ABIC47_002305 [Leifsonia sp. 563]
MGTRPAPDGSRAHPATTSQQTRPPTAPAVRAT